MAWETIEQWNNWIDSIKNDLTWLWDKIKNWWHELMKKIWLEKEQAIQETISDSQKKLDELAKKLIEIEFSKLEDKEIEENIEWKLDDENTILWMLAKNNEDIKNWFDWILEKDNSWNYIIDDEDLRSREIETILYSLKEISNNDTDNTKTDLTEQELKEIWEKAQKKMKLCDEVLSSEDIKNIPDDKKTKTRILEIYNNLLSENNWDISKIKKENIINRLKTEIEQEIIE